MVSLSLSSRWLASPRDMPSVMEVVTFFIPRQLVVCEGIQGHSVCCSPLHLAIATLDQGHIGARCWPLTCDQGVPISTTLTFAVGSAGSIFVEGIERQTGRRRHHVSNSHWSGVGDLWWHGWRLLDLGPKRTLRHDLGTGNWRRERLWYQYAALLLGSLAIVAAFAEQQNDRPTSFEPQNCYRASGRRRDTDAFDQRTAYA